MNFSEVYDELDRDRENLGDWWMRKRDVIAARAKRWIAFPMASWIEWESPRKVRYLVFSKVYGRKYNDNAATVAIALRRVKNGTEVYTTWLPWQHLAQPIVVLPHVFERYADPKRGNVRKNGVDLIKHFFEHNSYGEPAYGNELAGRSVRYNGEQHVCNCVSDGVLLGQMTDGIYVARTFITYDMATGLQKEEFETRREKVGPMGDTFIKIKKAYDC